MEVLFYHASINAKSNVFETPRPIQLSWHIYPECRVSLLNEYAFQKGISQFSSQDQSADPFNLYDLVLWRRDIPQAVLRLDDGL